MPKIKTHKAAAKRFNVRKGGTVKSGRMGLRHMLTDMSHKRKRQLGRGGEVHDTNMKAIKRLLPTSF